jgi:hypothetical protein
LPGLAALCAVHSAQMVNGEFRGPALYGFEMVDFRVTGTHRAPGTAATENLRIDRFDGFFRKPSAN